MLKTGGDIGYNIDGDLVPYFAFADNLVVLVRSIVSLGEQVTRVTNALLRSGLEVNPGKCSTMTVVCDRKLKKGAVNAELFLTINSALVPALSVGDAYRYLSLQVRASGTKATVNRKLEEQLVT